MSKKHVPDMDYLMDLKAKRAAAGGETRQGPAAGPQGTRKGPAKGPLVQRKLWLTADTWEALGRHFAATRVPVSTGLRGWIIERMEQEGLL